MVSLYIPVGCGGPLLCRIDRQLYMHHFQSMLLITLTQHSSNTVAQFVCMSLYLSMGFIAEGIFVNCFDLFVHTSCPSHDVLGFFCPQHSLLHSEGLSPTY